MHENILKEKNKTKKKKKKKKKKVGANNNKKWPTKERKNWKETFHREVQEHQ